MFIKMCGMTRREDIERAVELGVDAVGFIFTSSPRQMTPETAAELSRSIPVTKVGVFVNKELDSVADIRRRCKLDIIQLHGSESPNYCRKLGGDILKAVRMQNHDSLNELERYPNVFAFLLDTFVKGRPGGTGKQINRQLLDEIDGFSNIVLAGGMGVENIAEIIRRYHPFGVDINSKIETSPGVKDHQKMTAVMRNIKQVEVE